MNEIMSLDDDVAGPLQDQPIPTPSGLALIAGIFVRCIKCSRDFRSTLRFETLPDFERAARTGFIAQCPGCYTIFECNRDNMYCELAPRDHRAVSEVVPMPSPRRTK